MADGFSAFSNSPANPKWETVKRQKAPLKYLFKFPDVPKDTHASAGAQQQTAVDPYGWRPGVRCAREPQINGDSPKWSEVKLLPGLQLFKEFTA